MRAQAKVNAAAKRAMLGLAAGDIKAIRIGEILRVAIGSNQNGKDRGIGRYDGTAKLGVLPQYSASDGYRGFKAQAFIHGGPGQCGVGSKFFKLLGVAGKASHAVGD